MTDVNLATITFALGERANLTEIDIALANAGLVFLPEDQYGYPYVNWYTGDFVELSLEYETLEMPKEFE